MKNITKTISIALLSVTSILSFAQTSDEIIAKHIEAIGGKANWEKIKSFKTESLIKSQGSEIKVVSIQKDKTAMRQDIFVMGMTGYSIVTNSEGWNFMPWAGQTKPEPMTADDIKNSQDDLYLQDEFMTYKELGKKLDFVGKDDVDGTECFKFKMTDKNNQETTFYIDPSNYFVIKQTQKIKADGKEIESTTTYGDFKQLEGGITCPMSVTSNYGIISIIKLEINPIIDDSVFKLTN